MSVTVRGKSWRAARRQPAGAMGAVPHRRAYAAPLALLLLLLAAPSAPAQVEMPDRKKVLLEGTHVFRRILFDHDCKALDSFDALKEDPSRTILIVLGDLDRLDQVPGGLTNFVRRGGAVLLASDRPIGNADARDQVLAISGASINAETVICFHNGYKGLNYCPLLTPAPNTSPALLGGNEVFLPVATNVPSHLRYSRLPGGIKVLAYLPDNCAYDMGGMAVRPEVSPLPFMVGGEAGPSRVLVLADHSIFINEMMLPHDNNNVEFSYNCVRWLRGDTPRDRVLFIDDAGIQTKFEIPLKSVRPSFEELAEMIFAQRNRILQAAENKLVELERSNAFNAVVSRALNQIDSPPGRLFAILALIATLALMLYGVYRLGIRERFAHDLRTPLLAHAVARNLPVAPLVDQRTHTLLRLRNFNEPAARLVQRWFATQGIEIHHDPPLEPPVTAKGGRLRQLRRLWLLACGRSKEKVGPAGMWRLQRELEALATARQRGDWKPAMASQQPTRRGGTA